MNSLLSASSRMCTTKSEEESIQDLLSLPVLEPIGRLEHNFNNASTLNRRRHGLFLVPSSSLWKFHACAAWRIISNHQTPSHHFHQVPPLPPVPLSHSLALHLSSSPPAHLTQPRQTISVLRRRGCASAPSGYPVLFFCDTDRCLKGGRSGQGKMPLGGFAGLKEKVLKPGKEELKNNVGDSLGNLQK